MPERKLKVKSKKQRNKKKKESEEMKLGILRIFSLLLQEEYFKSQKHSLHLFISFKIKAKIKAKLPLSGTSLSLHFNFKCLFTNTHIRYVDF